MRHPSEYYIKFLLANSWGDEDNQVDSTSVNETLKETGLPPISDEVFDRIRSKFEPPETFRFNAKNHKPTVDFMKEEKLYSYWVSNGDMKRVFSDLLGDNNRLLQHRVHTMLMGFVPSDVIAEKVSRQYHLKESITAGMIEHYRHYFWRVENLTEKEWMELLDGHPQYDQYIAPLLCGDQQGLFRAGFNPKYDYKLGLRDTHRQVVFRIQYMAFKPDDKKIIDLLIKLSREQRALYDILYGEGGGFEDEVREIKHWMMEHKIPDVKTLDRLVTSGSYSGDGESDKKEKKEQVEETVQEAAQKAVTTGRKAKPAKKSKKPGVRVGPKKGDQ